MESTVYSHEQEAKLLPYGMTNFTEIITDNYYYVDKTMFIPQIERTSRFFFFVRPRRFGKSLFLNMLSQYYDKNKAEKFEEVFGSLWIGKHPTANRNKYMVLSFNFSSVGGSTLEEIQKKFDEYCGIILQSFARRYPSVFSEKQVEEMQVLYGCVAKLAYLCQIVADKEEKIYLVMDEYDNFANNVLSSYGTEYYRNMTHRTGFFREFLKAVKDYTSTVIERIFITGVSPVTMDDLTSGFNIALNTSNDPQFNAMIGFSEQELRTMLTHYQEQGMLKGSIDSVIEIMKPWYDNYCFSEESLDEPTLYNSDMVLYFLNSYLRTQRPPREMIDRNVRTDYNKLRHLIKVDKEFGENAGIIQELLINGGTTARINSGFSVHEMAKPDNFKSLLYYFGMLSIQKMKEGDVYLTIPNQVVREQIYGYMTDTYNESFQCNLDLDQLNGLMKNFAYRGEWRPYFDYIASQLRAQSSIREFMDGEAHVKAFLLSYMGLNRYYITYPEYEMNYGFSDFYLQPDLVSLPDLPYSYVIEIKYAKRDSDDSVLDVLLNEAREQLARYAASETVQRTKGSTQLRKIAVLYKGWELIRAEEV